MYVYCVYCVCCATWIEKVMRAGSEMASIGSDGGAGLIADHPKRGSNAIRYNTKVQ